MWTMSKEVEFDAGHRVPDHSSKCRNPHGHRYRVRATIGSRSLVESGSSRGMVLDFGDVKSILMAEVHDVLDHGFIVYVDDLPMMNVFGRGGYAGRTPRYGFPPEYEEVYEWKVIPFPYVPTAENIARWVFDRIDELIDQTYNDAAQLLRVDVWETPTSRATYVRDVITYALQEEQ